jgi:hypothetical protein
MAKENTALTVSQRASAMTVPSAFTVVKQVTRSVLKQIDGQPFYVMFQGAPYEGEEIKTGRGGAPKMAPARLADVVDLETGELSLLIMNAVLESELNRAYPPIKTAGDEGPGACGFLGKGFAILRGDHPEKTDTDKRYKLYRILEIAPKEGGKWGSAGAPVIDGTTKEAVDAAKARK